MKVTFVVVAVMGLAAISAAYPRARAGQLLRVPQARAPSESRTVWDAVFTRKQADRGEEVYTKRCSECHLGTLMGSDMTPPLVGGEFLSNWTDSSLGDLFERIRKTMPIDKPGSVPRDEIPDILAYILSVNKFPVGESELPGDTQVLNQIRIQATRPEQSKKSDKQ